MPDTTPPSDWVVLDLHGTQIASALDRVRPNDYLRAVIWGFKVRDAHGLTAAVLHSSAQSITRRLDVPYSRFD